MKKAIVSTLLSLLCATSYLSVAVLPVKRAAAESEERYACALSRDVYLYGAEDEESGLFCIPYTYYVKVLSEGAEYCYVQYATDTAPYSAVYGYCRTEQLHFVDFLPERPFLYYPIEVTYTLETGSAFPAGEDVFSEVTLTYAYYGDYAVGSSVYWYVALDGERGYLPRTRELSYELNTDFEQTEPGKDAGGSENGSPVPVAQIVLGVVLCLLAVGVAYYLLRPRRALPPPTENESEI